MAKQKTPPYVAFFTDIRKDDRFEVLGQIAGYNRYEALGRIGHLWMWCRDRKLADAPEDSDGYVVSEGVIRTFLGERGVEAILAGGLDDMALGVQVEGGIYLRGTSSAVAALRALSRSASAGGQVRAAGGRVAGRFAPTTDPAPADQPATSCEVPDRDLVTTQEPAGDQPDASQPPAVTSVPPSSFLLPPDQSVCPDARAPARATGFVDRRRTVTHAAWSRASKAHAALRADGVDPNAMPYPGLPVGAGAGEIVARVLELTAGDQPDYEHAERALAHVVAVRVAEAKRTQSLRYFAASVMWGKASFWRAADTSLDDARTGPPAKEASAAAPKKPANVGRVEPSAPSEYGRGRQTL